tara:strand:- start:113294 stop:113545 length:252 start_codon:yes stop_codon:yes gene_type:complete
MNIQQQREFFKKEAKRCGLCPGYQQLTEEQASESLRKVCDNLDDDTTTVLIRGAGMTSGARCLMGSRALLAYFEEGGSVTDEQ